LAKIDTQDSEPAQSSSFPNIRHAPGLTLTAAEAALLAQAFAGKDEVFVEREFRSGYSGVVVLLVSPGPGQAQVVVKVGSPTILQQEYAAYRDFVEPASLQNTARLQGEPLVAPDGQLALINYTFAGGDPRLPTHSLRVYYQNRGGQAVAEVLDRVFRIYGRQWWAINRPQKFVVGEHYDRMLYVHLKLEPAAVPAAQARILVAGQLGAKDLQDIEPGQAVRLEGFRVVEVRSDREEITLGTDPPPGEASAPLRVRVENEDISRYKQDQVLDRLDCLVTATRQTLLVEAVSAALPTFDPVATQLSFGGRMYYNPLLDLPDLLDRVIEARVSTIHGDLNLENILVDETTGFAWLIDFAETRIGPTLYDLQRLEGQLVTRLLPPAVARAGLGPEVMVEIFEALHADPPRLGAPHPALQEPYTVLVGLRRLARQYMMDDRDWDEYYLGLIIALLGTLKFRGLEPLAHKLALTGAIAARSLIRTPVPVWPRAQHSWELTNSRALIVEDDPVWQDIVQECLEEIGCLVELAATFTEARSKLQDLRFDLVTIDAHLGQRLETQEGILLLNYVRNRYGPALPVIIISGEIERRDVIRAFKKYAVTNVLLKEDFEYDEFRNAVRDALQSSLL
jgi:CheY-like chemotaxis protein